MNKNNPHQTGKGQNNIQSHHHKPAWTRIHHTWIFWFFLLLMLGAIFYYIFTDDFASVPMKEGKQQPIENPVIP